MNNEFSIPNGVIRRLIPLRSRRAGLLVLCILASLGLCGVFSFELNNILPATLILEVLFFSIVVYHIRRIPSGTHLLIIAAASYLLYGVSIAVMAGRNNLVDVLLIFKPFVYIIALCFLVHRNIFFESDLRKFFPWLLSIFFIKYFYAPVFGYAERPGVYTENNFELVLLLFIYYRVALADVRFRYYVALIVSMIFFLSGSRSGIISLLAVFGFMYLQKKIPRTSGFLLLSIAALVVIGVFKGRMVDIDISEVDRVVFLNSFFRETQSWSWVRYLIGSPPITPLSSFSCSVLNYYEALFSFSGSGECYSVILHSFLLRTIFDHGIFGLIFLMFSVWILLLKSGYEKYTRLCIVAVIFMNGLSVSALSSIYMILGLAIFMTFKENAQPQMITKTLIK